MNCSQSQHTSMFSDAIVQVVSIYQPLVGVMSSHHSLQMMSNFGRFYGNYLAGLRSFFRWIAFTMAQIMWTESSTQIRMVLLFHPWSDGEKKKTQRINHQESRYLTYNRNNVVFFCICICISKNEKEKKNTHKSNTKEANNAKQYTFPL